MGWSLRKYLYKYRNLKKKFSFLVLKKYSLLTYVIIWIFLWIVVIVWIIRSKLYSSHYVIKNVLITTWSISMYNDVDLYASIVSLYTGQYYSTLRLWSSTSHSINTLRESIEYIKSIQPITFSNNTLLVDVQFVLPTIVLRYNDKRYAIYTQWTILPLDESDQLGKTEPIISLPLYLSGMSSSISWVLYAITPSKLLQDYELLQTSPIQWSITYIPGGEKYVIWNPIQRVYFNAKKDIASQIYTLQLMKENYANFDNLEQIDVGSIFSPIVK